MYALTGMHVHALAAIFYITPNDYNSIVRYASQIVHKYIIDPPVQRAHMHEHLCNAYTSAGLTT